MATLCLLPQLLPLALSTGLDSGGSGSPSLIEAASWGCPGTCCGPPFLPCPPAVLSVLMHVQLLPCFPHTWPGALQSCGPEASSSGLLDIPSPVFLGIHAPLGPSVAWVLCMLDLVQLRWRGLLKATWNVCSYHWVTDTLQWSEVESPGHTWLVLAPPTHLDPCPVHWTQWGQWSLLWDPTQGTGPVGLRAAMPVHTHLHCALQSRWQDMFAKGQAQRPKGPCLAPDKHPDALRGHGGRASCSVGTLEGQGLCPNTPIPIPWTPDRPAVQGTPEHVLVPTHPGAGQWLYSVGV